MAVIKFQVSRNYIVKQQYSKNRLYRWYNTGSISSDAKIWTDNTFGTEILEDQTIFQLAEETAVRFRQLPYDLQSMFHIKDCIPDPQI